MLAAQILFRSLALAASERVEHQFVILAASASERTLFFIPVKNPVHKGTGLLEYISYFFSAAADKSYSMTGSGPASVSNSLTTMLSPEHICSLSIRISGMRQFSQYFATAFLDSFAVAWSQNSAATTR